MSVELIESVEDGIATLTLNRPTVRNAMTGTMLVQMHKTLTRIAADRMVRAVVVTGAGGAFCAGGDLGNFDAAPRGPGKEGPRASGFDAEAITQNLRQTCAVTQLLYEMPKPTLAVMPGVAAGAGFSLALACDLRIGSENARFLTSFSRIGLSGDLGGSYFLTQLVGAAKAREIYMLSDKVGAEEAFALGLLNRLVPADRLEVEASELARRLAALPTVAMGYIKKNLNAAQSMPLSQLLDLETMHMVRTMMTQDHKEGVRALIEKRGAAFVGR